VSVFRPDDRRRSSAAVPTRSCAALKLVLRTGVGVLWLSGATGAEGRADKAQLGRRADTSVVDPALGTQHSAPASAKATAGKPQPAPGTSHPAPSTRHEAPHTAPGTQYPALSVLTPISEIRIGDPSTLGRPVRVEGVVTYIDPLWKLLFVQDAEEGIFVQMRGLPIEVRMGEMVAVEGLAAPGDFAPMIDTPHVTRLGQGRMPVPARPSFQELLTGDWDSQLIELDGIVRGVHPLTDNKNRHLLFDVVVGTWRVLAQLPGTWTGPLPEHLVDAKVRIRGVAGTLFNQQRQLVGLQLFIPSLDTVTTLEAPRPDPFAAPAHTIASLNRWVSRHGVGRRVRVRGEVTWANGRQVYVRDMSGSIAVTLWSKATLAAGQPVDVSGFVAAGTYSPTLEDAVVAQSRARVEPAAAMPVSATELMSGQHDAGLVTLEAEVVNQVGEPDRQLVLKAGDLLFTAPGPPTGVLESFEPGTVVSVTGVCRVQVDPLDSPRVARGFQLLLRTPDDVRVVRRAAWSPRRTMQALGLLFTMVLAGLAWIVGLRRRVAQQTRDLREQLDRERALEAQYRELVATANDLVVTCDADARVTSINEAGQRITGQGADAAIGRPLRELVAATDRVRLDRELATALAARTGTTLEVSVASLAGATVTLELDVRPIYRRSRPAGLQAIGRDVTAGKRAVRRCVDEGMIVDQESSRSDLIGGPRRANRTTTTIKTIPIRIKPTRFLVIPSDGSLLS
jgi:PAS domain S-box-containing protein